MKRKEVPFYPTDNDYVCYCQTYNIPIDLVKTLFSLKRGYSPSFFEWLFKGESEEILPYTKKEYDDIFTGAKFAYENQHLMGRALPQNDERVIRINKFLIEQGCAIQFHPQHGMQIVEI